MNKKKIAQQMEVMIERSLSRDLYVIERDGDFLIRNVHNNSVILKNIRNYDLADFLCKGMNTVNQAKQHFVESKLQRSWDAVRGRLDKLFSDKQHYEHVIQDTEDTAVKEPLRHRLHTVEQDIELQTHEFVRKSNNVFYLFKNRSS